MADVAKITVVIGGKTYELDQALGKSEKKVKGFGTTVNKIGKIVGGYFTARVLYGVSKELINTSANMELIQKKAKTVFGDYKNQIDDAAKKTATSMGMTQNEYVNAAAGIQDLLIPMGFMRGEATNMTKDLVGLSGALAEWSAGKYDAVEVSKILSKAVLGEREQMKELGISIMEADVQAKLAAKGQKKLTGNALAQAKAQATLEIIFEKSTDAQKAFTTGEGSLVRNGATIKSNLNTIKETLAEALTPALKDASKWAAEFTGKMAEGTKEEVSALRDERIPWYTKLFSLMNAGGMVMLKQIHEQLQAADDMAAKIIEQGGEYVEMAKKAKAAGEVVLESWRKQMQAKGQADLEDEEAARRQAAEQAAALKAMRESDNELTKRGQIMATNKQYTEDYLEKERELTRIVKATAETADYKISVKREVEGEEVVHVDYFKQIANLGLAPMTDIIDRNNQLIDEAVMKIRTLGLANQALAQDWGVMGNAAIAAGMSMMDSARYGITSLDQLGAAAINAAKEVVAAAIAEGVASAIAEGLASAPPPYNLAIAAAAGAGAYGLFMALVPSFAGGGGAWEPTLAMIGDHRGATRSNPEAVLSVNDINRLIQGKQQRLVTYLDGYHIAIALENYNSQLYGIK